MTRPTRADAPREVEERLRDALSAQAALLTQQSLHPAAPPAPAGRRRWPARSPSSPSPRAPRGSGSSRWAVPVASGLAVAAAVAWAFTAAGPPSGGEPPAGGPAPTASPRPSSTPSPSPARSPSSSPSSLPVLATRVAVAGWVLRTPAGWQVSRPYDERVADVACVGPADAPCAVTVARRTDRGAYPEASVLGGGLVPGGPSASTCTSLRGEPEEWLLGGRDGDVTAGVHFRCRGPGRAAAHHAVQVWIPEDYRLAWTESTQDRTVMAVMRTLDLDPARPR